MSVVTQIVGSVFSSPLRTTTIAAPGASAPSLAEAMTDLSSGLEGIRIESLVVAPDKGPTPKKVAPKPKDKGAAGPVVIGHDVDVTGREIIVSPTFKLVFLTLVGLTVLCGVATIALAFWVDPARASLGTAFEAMSSGWKLGLGAVFGLLGGKAVA